jgi:hypothetical protein
MQSAYDKGANLFKISATFSAIPAGGGKNRINI